MNEARTFPTEIQALFESAGYWPGFPDQTKTIMQGLGVKLEPFCVPHTSNPAANDLRGFEMLAYGRGGTSYGVLANSIKAAFGDQARRAAQAQGKSDKEVNAAAQTAAGKGLGYLGVALFRVAWLTAREMGKVTEGQVPGNGLGNLRFSVNVDAAMLAEPLLTKLIDDAQQPPFTLLLEASEDLQIGDVKSLQTRLALNDWLKLALDDSDKMRADTRKLLSERVDLVKADGIYVRRLFEDELVQPGTMLPALLKLRQPGKPFVAEGVENTDIRGFLRNPRNWDVNTYGELLMQGWHMRVPAPWDDFLKPINDQPDQPKAYVLPEVQRVSEGVAIGTLPGETGPAGVASTPPEGGQDVALLGNISAILETAHELRSSLALRAGLKQETPAKEVAEALFRAPVWEIIEDLLVPVTRELMRPDTEQRWKVWDSVNTVFGWLCLRNANDAPNNGADWKLTDSKLCSVEIYAARAVQRPAALLLTPHTPDVCGRGAVTAEWEGGWKDNQQRYQQLLARLWNLTFPARKRANLAHSKYALEPLTPGEFKDLKAEMARLKRTNAEKYRTFYLALPESSKGVDWDELLEMLGQDFQGLTVVVYHAKSGTTALLVPEADFAATLRGFLEIEHEYSR